MFSTLQDIATLDSTKIGLLPIMFWIYTALGGGSLAWPMLIFLIALDTAVALWAVLKGVYKFQPGKFRNIPKKIAWYAVIILAVRAVDFTWYDAVGSMVGAWKLVMVVFATFELSSILRHLEAMGFKGARFFLDFITAMTNKVRARLGMAPERFECPDSKSDKTE